ncbi:ABC transporter ATP-binding protein [Larkinella terrae]|uniref:ATP-binding cassette domain-containing protein n=1 Tax=Larkinella terrae TaxID=2025311 RepID=A0A7K0EDN7_9BACT|nr:ABC transporter ATP-binding protein [Larkinella terrae]MRS59980.1 ATP-binding cassette domain-containing protein [Larkinella terrae]
MELVISNLSKSYHQKTVLDSINLAFQGGDVVGLLGKNGSGKTTLLNCLIDLIAPDSGQFFFNDEELTGDRLPFKEELGIVSDVIPPVPEFTGTDYLRFKGLIHRLDESTFKKRSTDLTNFFFDDASVLKKKISQYSTGMIKKISLCGAILNTPSVLILDEPFAGLDPVAVRQLISFLQTYRRADRIILIASHDLSYIEEIASRILVLDDTQIKFNGELAKFTEQGTKVISEALFELLAPKTKQTTFDWI